MFVNKKPWSYGVYSIQSEFDAGRTYTRSFIVIRDQYGLIVRFTNLEMFAGIYKGKTYRPITSDPQKKLHYICRMLNYCLIEHGKKYKIRHVFGITKSMLNDFFHEYALEQKADGSHKGSYSIEKCIGAVTGFMWNLAKDYGGYMKIHKEDLYVEKTVYVGKGKNSIKKVPDFCIPVVDEVKPIFRDIPTEVFEVMLPLAFRYVPDIALGICLQAFAGLRAGEVCNVRQESSPLGPGFIFTKIPGRVTKIEIDLSKEMILRSDLVCVGRIKKERFQCVYPAYIDVFVRAYEMHLEYLKSVDYEAEYAPMFVNQRGMAMTYKNYLERFHYFVEKHLRPALLKSEVPTLRLYGQLLYENRLGPHALRHWYTVQLVLRGEDIGNIQFWRGDKSPQSAFTYLQNKGDLNRQLEDATDQLLKMLLDTEDMQNGAI